MEINFTEQVVRITLLTALLVNLLRSQMEPKGTSLKLIELNKMEINKYNDIGDNARTNICYCEGDVCYYCPLDLYCNNDNSGCCSTPNSDNYCGSYCVPPEHTCCNNKGACPNDHPTCCDEYCCKESANCCGEDCCSKQSKCCKNNQNKHFCISRQLSIIDPSPDYCTKDNCEEPPDMGEIFNHFSNMCKLFATGTREQSKSKKKTPVVQFAVLTLNKASSDITSSDRYEPFPLEFNNKKQNGNYASSPPMVIDKTLEHAERVILLGIEHRIEWFRENKPESKPFPPTIYLFTFLSPCVECLKDIISAHDKYTIFIGWHLTFNRMKQKDFLNGIGDLMKNNINIVYSIDTPTCTLEELSRPPLVQPTMLNYLVSKLKNVEFCDTEMALRSSFIKLINWLVWNCKDSFSLDGTKSSANDVINCMKKEIQNINPKINPCIDLPDLIEKSIYSLNDDEKGKKLLLSPPLDPKSQTISISNVYTDLIGEYGNPYLCFQVNY